MSLPSQSLLLSVSSYWHSKRGDDSTVNALSVFFVIFRSHVTLFPILSLGFHSLLFHLLASGIIMHEYHLYTWLRCLWCLSHWYGAAHGRCFTLETWKPFRQDLPRSHIPGSQPFARTWCKTILVSMPLLRQSALTALACLTL